MHKGKGFLFRLGCAFEGIRIAFGSESSFRTQIFAAILAILSLVVLRPSLVWSALILVMVFLVLAAELFNTAIEHVLDGLHPEKAEFVRAAKDCSAAAVLVLSVASLVVFVLMLASLWS
jgi:diacylglycerol kinase (ATP)